MEKMSVARIAELALSADFFRHVPDIVDSLIGDSDAESKLVTLARGGGSEVIHAVLALAFRVDPSRYTSAFEFLLSHPDEEVRMNYCAKVGEGGAPEAARILLKAMKIDPSGEVRCVAVAALGQVGEIGMIPEIERTVEGDPAFDYEGRTIQELANHSIALIRQRSNLNTST